MPKRLPAAETVHATLGRHLLTDGYSIVLDMEHSQGVRLRDAATGKEYLDFFTFFASSPLGMNHPKLRSDKGFVARLMDAAINKVANSDIYTPHFARFVDTFSRVAIPAELPYTFFVAGGALAVENALKIAFDWKVRKNFAKGYAEERGHKVLHLEHAFHGRSGYTMSLTNTDPNKVKYFPKFNWPRIPSPYCNGPEDEKTVADRERQAITKAEEFFRQNPDDIAAIILEPIQGEGGDNHFRKEFLLELRRLADENEALLIFDEVQTGVCLTGSFWAWQGLGVTPDIISFGKKTQVCGVLAGRRIDDVEDHVFNVSSRINSTWGGNIVDMVRFDRILEIIEEDHLLEQVQRTGAHLLRRLREFADEFEIVSNPRGKGLMCAIDFPDAETRNAVRKAAYERGLIILGCGAKTLRFRPALIITEDELDEGLAILKEAIVSVDS